MPKLHRALISVYDKTGLSKFAAGLKKHHIEILSTGGTAKYLQEHGIETRSISEITGFPEILGGRVKTLHPKVFGGILALRNDSIQTDEIEQHGINLIDLVVVNLYPFEATVAKENITVQEALENIDIGGPCLIRAAAKNYLDVTVVTSPEQYERVLTEIDRNAGEASLDTRKVLAAQAFAVTSRYDSLITNYLSEKNNSGSALPEQITFRLEKVQDLRYGENPHQHAALYKQAFKNKTGLLNAQQLHGKELSFNNLIDLDAAMGIAQEFSEPCVAVIKHTNPCGVAVADSLVQAYQNAKATDPVSAFGGIVGLNRRVDAATAQAIAEVFTEAIIAPGYEAAALEILQSKKNLRLLETPEITKSAPEALDLKRVQGCFLLQNQDKLHINDISFKVASKRQPTEEEWTAMKFAWRICKWVKSNAIVYATQDRTIGIGAGQMSRVDSSRIAIEKAKEMQLSLAGTAIASDAFFPFRDAVDLAAEAGATAIIQPGGSVRDNEVIAAANEHDMTMVFTNVRHFRH